VAEVIEQGKQRLDEGDWIVIFPEGTRMAAGETRRYGVSGTLLAIETGRLIVPVAHNAGFYWPPRSDQEAGDRARGHRHAGRDRRSRGA